MGALKLYADENVNPEIINGQRRRGVKAWLAMEVGNLGINDEEQLEYSSKEQAVLFTHDSDLISLL